MKLFIHRSTRRNPIRQLSFSPVRDVVQPTNLNLQPNSNYCGSPEIPIQNHWQPNQQLPIQVPYPYSQQQPYNMMSSQPPNFQAMFQSLQTSFEHSVNDIKKSLSGFKDKLKDMEESIDDKIKEAVAQQSLSPGGSAAESSPDERMYGRKRRSPPELQVYSYTVIRNIAAW